MGVSKAYTVLPSDAFIIRDVYAQANEVAELEWLQKDLSFSDEYLAKLIGASQKRFSQWKSGEQTLTSLQVQKLKNLSTAMARLVSFLSFRPDLIRRVLEFHCDAAEIRRTKLTPPWLGMSLRNYMLRYRTTGVNEVESWVQRVRSANAP
jgi:transcriptional regulator with XRE-family HTH domain